MRRFLAGLGVVALLAVSAAPAVAATPPPNDGPSGAIAITALPFTYSQDTTAATSDPGVPTLCAGTNTVWYKYNAGSAGNGHVILDTNGTSPDGAYLYISVLEGSATGALLTCGGVRVEFAAKPSTTYYIMVGDPSGVGGNLVFNASQGIVLTETVAPSASVTRGVVTLTGTYRCSEPTTMSNINFSMTQAVGRLIINGSGYLDLTSVACVPGRTYSWSGQVSGMNGRFAGGKARVMAQLSSVDWYQYGTFAVQIKGK